MAVLAGIGIDVARRPVSHLAVRTPTVGDGPEDFVHAEWHPADPGAGPYEIGCPDG